MSKDSQELEILESSNLEKPKMKKNTKPKLEEPIEEPKEDDLFSKIMNEMNNLKAQLDDINEFKKKMSEPKPKRERTDGQKRALEKARANAKHNAALRLQEKLKIAEEQNKKYEEEVLKKAISIKKREIKEKAKLKAIPDDDTPIEKIKEISKKIDTVQEQLKPKFIFI